MEDFKCNVIKNFNDELGYSLDNLETLEEILERLQMDKNKIEEKLSLASSEAPSKMQEVIEEVYLVSKNVKEMNSRCEKVYAEIDRRLQKDNKTSELQNLIDDISYLEKASSYLQFVRFIEDLSSELDISLRSGNDEACIASFVMLKETYENIEISDCMNLKNYIQDILQYWYDQIEKKIVTEYKEILKSLKWPFVRDSINPQPTYTPSTSQITEFRIVTEHLFHLQLPITMIKQESSALDSNLDRICLPITLLVQPLKQRFEFHFSGLKQTNRRDKPEWYFTQILSWIKDHIDWVEKMVQPVADATNFNKINVKVQFMKSLVKLAVRKLDSDLSDVQYDDALFAHTVDEAITFEKELKTLYEYPSLEPASVLVLTQAQYFTKWITIEKKCATERIDSILSSPSAWSKLLGFEEDVKITECGEKFIMLLNTISDRYNNLIQPGHRLQFLDLQLELIDDWRVRLLQLLHADYQDPLQSLTPSILNTVHYVIQVLQDWGVNISFLSLHYYKKRMQNVEKFIDDETNLTSFEENDSDSSVFDEVISLLQRLEKKLIKEIDDSAFMDIKSKSRQFCNEKWFAVTNQKESVALSVTPSSCLMFQEILNKLHNLHKALASDLFKQSWKTLAMRLDQYLLDELILRNQFSAGGSMQFVFDIKRNLFPLFGLYTEKPETFFPLISEASILLNMLLGSVMLLIEALETEEENEANEILADVNIYQLSPEIVIRVLKNRMDISTR